MGERERGEREGERESERERKREKERKRESERERERGRCSNGNMELWRARGKNYVQQIKVSL